ncbi:PAS domain-containing sensor histidine kinase [Hwanghaeella grinnelliae]|uniref:histidine kinase n=1 Tax=Hwanghaeella grinnelliae TaxID=2500179 RepID=A0A437QP65_9PROT|nr:PAS domain-containing sensor histidine kinase [Hwanghaeella grinnelliae]RVU36328.1 PAS domain-containing sensor histidine kinase [Hwanghaeella grinnelliae]
MSGDFTIAALACIVLGGIVGFSVAWWRQRRLISMGRFLVSEPSPAIIIMDNHIEANAAAARLLQRDRFDTLMDLCSCLSAPELEAQGKTLHALLEALRRTGAGLKEDVQAGPQKSEVRLTGFPLGGGVMLRFDDRDAEIAARNDARAAHKDRIRIGKILDALPLPVWWRNPVTMKVDGGNKVYATAIGLEGSVAIPGTNRDLMIGLVGEEGTALARRALSRSTPQSESHHVVINGTRQLYDFVEQRLDDDGTIIGFGENQTSLEAMQTSLAENVAAQDAILENLLTAVAIFGPDRRLNFYNSAYARLWGLETEFLDSQPGFEEVVGILYDRRQMPETIDQRAELRARVELFTSVVETREELMHLPDERSIRLLISPHPKGGLFFQFEDVTDRLALERSYNTLTQVQQATLNNLYEGFAVFSRDGRLRLHNRAYQEIWRLSDADLKGSPHVSQLLEKVRPLIPHAADWEEFKRSTILAITEPKPDAGRYEFADDRIVDRVEVPLPDGQCLMLYLDVTDSLRVQRALEERNAALENADLLKSRFISNMSYELRTPLNTIIGFTEILQSGLAGELNTKQTDYVSNVLEASQHLARMVGDILDLATIQAGFMQLDIQEVDVATIVADLTQSTRGVAEEKSIAISLDQGPKPLLAACDTARIRQVLSNLLGNAIKFTPEGGTVEVRVLPPQADTPEIRVVIEDTGGGISEEDRERVFESFVQASSGTKQSGAGLGLALSKSLIELHGGRIVLGGSSTGGTSAICYIPVKPRRSPLLDNTIAKA